MFPHFRFLFRKSLLTINPQFRNENLKCVSYRAAVLNTFGRKLKVKLLESNNLKQNEIKINVKYCSLNQLDVSLVKENSKIKLPFILGREFSGRVLDAGGADGINTGDNVVVITDEYKCGGLAEEAIVPHSQFWPVPSELSLQEATVIPVSYGTAILTLTQFCNLEENDLIIITAGPAGLGLAAVDVASSLFKAKVIVIYDTEGSSDIAREKGAYKTIKRNPNSKKLYKEIEEVLKEKKAKVVYDAIGGELLHILADFVDPEQGLLFSVDPFYNVETFKNAKPDISLKSENIEAKIRHVNFNKLQSEDNDLYRQIVTESLSLASEKSIAGHISKIFSLDQINSAFEFIKAKQCTGKVLVDIQAKDESADAGSGNEKKEEDIILKSNKTGD